MKKVKCEVCGSMAPFWSMVMVSIARALCEALCKEIKKYHEKKVA